MKRFCDLKVGDNLYIYFDNGVIKKEINKIYKFKKYMILKTDWCDFLISDIEKDFLITEADVFEINEAISTSMDRLLLEMEEN